MNAVGTCQMLSNLVMRGFEWAQMSIATGCLLLWLQIEKVLGGAWGIMVAGMKVYP